MSDLEQQLRESLQPMIHAELMKSWNEGVAVGLKMAHDMAQAVRNEAARVIDDPDAPPTHRVACEAQIAALGGLMAALKAAESDVPKKSQT